MLALLRTVAEGRSGWIANVATAMRKLLAHLPGTWTADTFGTYAVTLIRITSWKTPMALVLMFCMVLAQGAQLLLLVPLMQVVGLDVEQGSVGWVAEFVSSVFAAGGLQPSLVTVLVAFGLITSLLALLTRWQTTSNFKLQQDFVLCLRRRLYRAIANTDWLTFSRIRSSDFTHVLTTELDRVGGATYYLLGFVTNILLAAIYLILALQLSLTMTALVLATGIVLLVLLRKKMQVARWTGEDI